VTNVLIRAPARGIPCRLDDARGRQLESGAEFGKAAAAKPSWLGDGRETGEEGAFTPEGAFGRVGALISINGDARTGRGCGGFQAGSDPPGTAAIQAKLPVFGALRARDVRSLAGPVIEAIVPEGTELVREGTTIGVFSVIRTGSVALCHGGETVGLLGAGDCFGESDPHEPAPQPFTLVARTGVRLTTFSAFGIDRLCGAIPGSRERLSDACAAALAQGIGIEHGDRPVIGGHPAQLAHQPKRARNGLARRPGPARKLVLGER
jgi:hypothetical protein